MGFHILTLGWTEPCFLKHFNEQIQIIGSSLLFICFKRRLVLCRWRDRHKVRTVMLIMQQQCFRRPSDRILISPSISIEMFCKLQAATGNQRIRANAFNKPHVTFQHFQIFNYFTTCLVHEYNGRDMSCNHQYPLRRKRTDNDVLETATIGRAC